MIVYVILTIAAYLAVLSYLDCRYRRLPNVLTLGGAIVALAVRYGFGGMPFGNSGLLGGLVCGLFLMLPFILHSADGGDVKMLFSVGCIMGLRKSPEVILYTSLAGLAVAAFMLIAGLADGRRLKHFARCLFDWRYDRKAGRDGLPPRSFEKARIPFGVVIAIGTMLSLFTGGSWQ